MPEQTPKDSGADPFDKSTNTGFRHLLNSTRFSLQGLTTAARNESAFRQELALFIILLPAAFWLAQTPVTWAMLVAVNLLVLMAELMNSAIEACIDRIGPEQHPLSGNAKDMGSAAVMLALTIAFLVWSSVIVERFW